MRRRGVLAALLASALSCGGCAPGEPSPTEVRSVLLVTLDTTRRDALGCYGRDPSPTPALDRFAEGARVFERARTVTPMTLPSHASMLTGLVPPRHTVRDNSRARLPEEAVTVAELARDAGLRTGAVLAAPVLDASFGLSQGFDDYDAPTQDEARRSGRHGGRLASDVTARALAWLDAGPDRPFVLWVHYFDPHEVYEPAPEHLLAAGGDAYLGEVAQLDAAFGALVDGLAARELTDSTAVLVVADHGEALGEHGEETHSAFVYDSTLLVPFLLRGPGAPAGREHAQVSVVDVAPTLLDALGLAVPADLDGESLWLGAPARRRPVYFESLYGAGYFQWSPLVGVVLEDRKYVHSSRPEVYDVARDPDELAPLTDADFARRALAALEITLARPRLGAAERAGDGPDVATLRALGYVGEGLDAGTDAALELEPGERPSPHDRAEVLRDVREVLALHNAGEREATIPRIRAVLERDPRNHTMLSLLGQNLRALGRPAEALAPLERFVEVGPAWESTWLELARTYVTLERTEDALRWYDRILARRRDAAVASEVARVFAHLGRQDDGVAWLAARGFAPRPPEGGR